MTKRPDGGWPWEQPGYTFATGWPRGYVCTAADQMLSGRITGAVASQTSSKTRERMMTEGKGWGSGTLAPFSAKSDPSKGGQAVGALRTGVSAFSPVHVQQAETKIGRPSSGAEGSPERQDAQRRGLKRFTLGTPCSKGHRAERYTCDAKCVECARLKRLKGTRSRGRAQ